MSGSEKLRSPFRTMHHLQAALFASQAASDLAGRDKAEKLSRAMDKINHLFGRDSVLIWGSDSAFSGCSGQPLAGAPRKIQAYRTVDPPGALMIPRMAIKPQAFVTLPKAPVGGSGNDTIERFNHRLIAGGKIPWLPGGTPPVTSWRAGRQARFVN